MKYYGYLFETRSIQNFLFANGKLKDMVAGSEMVDSLLGGPLDQAIEAVGLGLDIFENNCPRRAGGAFYLVIPEDSQAQLERFRALWRFLVSNLLPGIEQIDVISEGSTAQDALRSGLQTLRAARNLHVPDLPPASPPAQRDPRTGLVAIARDNNESIDAATSAKRKFSLPDNAESVATRFIGSVQPERGGKWNWPNNFSENTSDELRFPMQGRSHVALIHADGNGMGQLLMHLNQAFGGLDADVYVELFRSFSDGLASATKEAAAKASAVIVDACSDNHVIPARPLVLGGDDITLIVRDDLAFEFTEQFLKAFENETAVILSQLCEKAAEKGLGAVNDKLPSQLSASAGVVFMKPSQPFSSCHDIAEGLCKRAKGVARRILAQSHSVSSSNVVPSTVSFHKLKAALIEDEGELFNAEMVAGQTLDKLPINLGLPGYVIKATLGSLKALAAPFEEGLLNPKRLRRLLTLMNQDVSLASQEYQRWRDISETGALKQFDKALQGLIGLTLDGRLPVVRTSGAGNGSDEAAWITPLSDLLVYLDTRPKPDGEIDHDD